MNKKHYIILTLAFVFLGQPAFGLKVPELKGRINDYANILNYREKVALENLLLKEESATSSQIVLLTISSLNGENLEDYSMQVVEKWKIGQKEFDNGVLLLIAIKEKKIRIEVGYGLESILTDAKSGFIIRNIIVPNFKHGDIYKGIVDGMTSISGLISNKFEITDKQLAKYKRQQKGGEKKHLPATLIVFLLMFFLGSLGRRNRGSGILPWLLIGGMMGSSSSHRNSGFGGGGFSGFSGGGGGFGGGGASGGW
mmetsp:Transcript_21194/g.9738  ORF Transcript_21194/g.9738 Transcript_21194/m.9738 type:complete len:254 (-) Transcript_21194:466-1227(-)